MPSAGTMSTTTMLWAASPPWLSVTAPRVCRSTAPLLTGPIESAPWTTGSAPPGMAPSGMYVPTAIPTTPGARSSPPPATWPTSTPSATAATTSIPTPAFTISRAGTTILSFAGSSMRTVMFPQGRAL